jgi:PLD-like domain
MKTKTWFTAKRFITHPLTIAFLIAAIYEWTNDFNSITNFITEPISTIIKLAIIFGISSVAWHLVRKIFSITDFIVETELRTKIDDIIYEAKEYVYIISPYLNPGNLLIESLIKTSRSGIDVILIHHSSQLKKYKLSNDLNRLIDAGVKIYHHPSVHSKIYINESESLVTSLNLVVGSYSDSFESGIFSNEREIRIKTKSYIEDQILNSDLCKETTIENLPPDKGYCISTKNKIDFEPSRPVEYNEFKSKYGQIIGKYCHSCGLEVETSVNQPFCANCQEMHSLNNSNS